jgi:hypothetical protein
LTAPLKAIRLRLDVLRALVDYYELRDAIAELFKRGEHGDVVRCSEVATAMAERFGKELSTQWRRRCRHAAGLGGWNRIVRRSNVPWYRGMVRR